MALQHPPAGHPLEGKGLAVVTIQWHVPALPRPPVGAPCGLHNLNNTCYANSMLQIMRRMRMDQRSALQTTGLLALCQNDGQPMTPFMQAATPILMGDSSFTSNRRLKAVRDEVVMDGRFAGWEQHDPYEFFLGAGDCFQSETKLLSERVGYSIPNPLNLPCGFTLESTCVCMHCHTRGEPKREDYTSLSIPIGKSRTSVFQALTRHLKDEPLQLSQDGDGSGGWYCPRCRVNVEASREHRGVGASPPYLLLQLKRVDFEGGAAHKLHTPCAISPVLPSPCGTLSPDGMHTEFYRVVGVLSHQGESMGSGHYISHITNGGSWWRFNDERVEPLQPDTLSSDQAAREAYMLLYERCTPDDSSRIAETARSRRAAREQEEVEKRQEEEERQRQEVEKRQEEEERQRQA
eukprot:6644701-Prymnesium_polylepis.1